MEWDRIEGNWKRHRDNVKRQWTKLTEAQLDVIAGRRNQLAARIQEAYGVTPEAADREIATWQKNQKEPQEG